MGSTLEVGDKAPEFSLPDQHGKAVALKSFKGKQVVLYFYPKDDTPGCTKESCDFRDVESQIVRAGAVIVGVSMDGQDSHQKFIKKYGLPFPLLSDEDAAISKRLRLRSIGQSNSETASSPKPGTISASRSPGREIWSEPSPRYARHSNREMEVIPTLSSSLARC